jgi:hypothetical protein
VSRNVELLDFLAVHGASKQWHTARMVGLTRKMLYRAIGGKKTPMQATSGSSMVA